MDKCKIPYSVIRNDVRYFQASPDMRNAGMESCRCGAEGPQARARAWELYERWQSIRHQNREQNKPREALKIRGDKVGYVYFLGLASRVKIGFSTNPGNRLNELRTGLPNKPDFFIVIQGTLHDEKQLHHRLKAYRKDGEWFTAGTVVMRTIMDRVFAAQSKGMKHPLKPCKETRYEHW